MNRDDIILTSSIDSVAVIDVHMMYIRSSNREKEELEAHVPSSNAWEEVSSLVDLSLGAGEAEDNNRMREVILRMKHKVSASA